MGNSVTRHYAFGLKGILDKTHDNQTTDEQRREEKSRCNGVLGTSSCKLYAYNGATRTNITFFWKNFVSENVATDDLRRDICANNNNAPTSLRECLSKHFNGTSSGKNHLPVYSHGATARDVLVVGSVALNSTYFLEHGGSSLRDLHIIAPMFGVSAQHADVELVVQELLGSFPGTIIWLSNTHLNLQLNNAHTPQDINGCYAYIDSRVRCAVRRQGGRIQYLDNRDMQTKYIQAFESREAPSPADKGPYLDVIHHPGALSEAVMRSVLAMLPN
jgi:hypothetical protein